MTKTYIQHAKSGEIFAAEISGGRITAISEALTQHQVAKNDPADFEMEACDQEYGDEWAIHSSDDIKRRCELAIR